jgi:hypothetical protein
MIRRNTTARRVKNVESCTYALIGCEADVAVTCPDTSVRNASLAK